MVKRSIPTYRIYQVISVLSLLALFVLNWERSFSAPLIVQEAFQEKFYDAENVESWQKKGSKLWEISFSVDDRYHYTVYHKSGLWVSTNQQLYYSEIPKLVIDAIDNNYPDKKLDEIYFSSTPQGNYFQVLLKEGISKTELKMESNGVTIEKL